jgi:hypothetical protein
MRSAGGSAMAGTDWKVWNEAEAAMLMRISKIFLGMIPGFAVAVALAAIAHIH